MREAARESLYRGEGVATLTAEIHNKANAVIGYELEKEEIDMPEELKDAKFVALSDVMSLLKQAADNLNRLSPHPRDDCVVAMESSLVSKLSLALVRTSSPQKDLVSPKSKNIASAETDLGKKAANIAGQIIDAQFKENLTAEKYIDLLNSSPMPAVTKAAIRLAQGGGAQVRGTHGDFSKKYKKPLPKDIQCSEPQTLKVRVGSILSDGAMATAHVTEFGNHTVFWKSVTDPRIEIEVPETDWQRGLLLARLLNEEIELEVSLSISMLHGKRGTDLCKASILKMPQLKELAVKAIRRLNEQLSLDLQFPD